MTESKPLWEYVAEVAKNLGEDAFYNMESADGDVFQLMNELSACALLLEGIADRLRGCSER